MTTSRRFAIPTIAAGLGLLATGFGAHAADPKDLAGAERLTIDELKKIIAGKIEKEQAGRIIAVLPKLEKALKDRSMATTDSGGTSPEEKALSDVIKELQTELKVICPKLEIDGNLHHRGGNGATAACLLMFAGKHHPDLFKPDSDGTYFQSIHTMLALGGANPSVFRQEVETTLQKTQKALEDQKTLTTIEKAKGDDLSSRVADALQKCFDRDFPITINEIATVVDHYNPSDPTTLVPKKCREWFDVLDANNPNRKTLLDRLKTDLAPQIDAEKERRKELEIIGRFITRLHNNGWMIVPPLSSPPAYVPKMGE